ncbi:hypothetical protein E4191_07670 [Paracoccus liaowanqingii]|uniref:Uncharacterized protein n=1 Tax=Paracoccus liaowanqingii TaxID=2560053 RepID=A0A4V1BJ04_9RHOB|nr:hypothetical protein [Paracoccus liaowanqingii]QBX34602.1 hypothetical protein E4191_07670 [Paracoccus liaowanqingii]
MADRSEGGPGGRPAKTLTYEQEVQLEALASVLTAEQIADRFGMARSTLFKIMAEDPEIRARFDMGKAKAIEEIGGKLMEKARKGDTASIIFFLKTQAGWRETSKVELTGPQGGPVQTLDVSKLSDAALAEMLAVADAQKEDISGD